MSVAEAKTTELAVSEFSEAEIAIAKLTPYMELVVAGPDDEDGFKKVKEAAKEVRTLRLGVEKSRKELKAFYLEGGRRVDAKAKEVKAEIEKIENHLDAQKKIVTDEQLRLKRLESDRLAAVAKDRAEKLNAVGYSVLIEDAGNLTKEAFLSLLQVETGKHEARLAEEAAEKKRQAELAEANRIEQERLEAERAKQEAEAKAEREKLQAERDAMEAEREKVRKEQAEAQAKIDEAEADAKAERERLERIEFERVAKIEAEKKAATELAEKQRREAEQAEEEKKRQAEADDAERLRKEEADRQAELMKTDTDKLLELAEQLESLEYPELKADAAIELAGHVKKHVGFLAGDIRTGVES